MEISKSGKTRDIRVNEETRNKLMRLKYELKSVKSGKSVEDVIQYLLEIREKYILLKQEVMLLKQKMSNG